MMFMAMDDDIPCTITDESSGFQITDIEQDGSGNTFLTWTSCSDHVYGIFSSADLSNWVGVTAMWGEDLSTTWEDTNTASGVTSQFYKVVRIPPAEGYNGDAIPSGWAVDNRLNPLDPNLDSEDPDNDFWSNLGEYQKGTDPNNPASLAPYSFTINGGADVVTNAQVQLGFPGLVADHVIISESITMTNGVTNSFASPFTYTLLNTNDGLHSIYLQLLKNSGTLSPVFGQTIELDTHPPTISIGSPSNGVTVVTRRINIQGFAADAATNAPALDTNRWLQVTVNGDFVNGRDTNGNWWAGLEDLVAGTNTFTAVAADHAGFTVTNSVWLIYDPTSATNLPVFTVDVTNTIVVGSNATTIAVSGGIDNDNATIQIDVLDAMDNTITNSTVNAAVHGTNWWGEVPIVPGSNIVVVSARNSGSIAATNSFTIIQNTSVFLEIDSPVAGTDVNATNVTVTGFASTNFTGTITVNGQTASTTSGSGGITFSATVSLNNIDANVIEAQAIDTDGSAATAREVVYGYEVVQYWENLPDDWRDVDTSCWFVQNYPHSHPYRGEGASELYWSGPGNQFLNPLNYDTDYSLDGDCLASPNCNNHQMSFTWDPNGWSMDGLGWYQSEVWSDGHHLDAGYYQEFSNCPTNVDCAGSQISGCCVDAQEHSLGGGHWQGALTFIKHWPVDEEQTVILHFDNMLYYLPPFPFDTWDSDPNQITFWGQPGLIYSTNDYGWYVTTNIGFVVKIKTNTRYTITENDFTYPTITATSVEQWPNAQSTSTAQNSVHILYFAGIGNLSVSVDGPTNVLYLCNQSQQTNVLLTARAKTSTGELYTVGTYTWSVIAGASLVQITSTNNVATITPKAPSINAGDVQITMTFTTPYNVTLTTTNSLTVLTPAGIQLVSWAPGDLSSGVGFTNACVYQIVNQLPDHGALRVKGINVHEDFPTPAPAPCSNFTRDAPTDANGRVHDEFQVDTYCADQLDFTMIQRLTVDCVTNCHNVVCTHAHGIAVGDFGTCQ